jgi:hypothetical protein
MTYTNDDLLKMTPDQLSALFRESPPGPIPNGAAKGTALIDTGTPISPVLAEVVRVFAWQGKTFDAASDTLVNSITFFGVSAIEAKISVGPSLIDGNDCIILDYSANPGIVGQIRDEIRLISPQLYLGVVYLNDKQVTFFSLLFNESGD